MARIVTITQPTDTVRCDPNGHAVYVFTVTNISGASLRVGAQVLVDGPTQASWLTIEGPSERDLDINASDQITVRAQIPADTPPGKYTFRLLVFSVKQPGEDYTEGETVAIEVPPTAKPEPAPQPSKRFPWWIPTAVVAVLLIGGVITWLVWPRGIEVPEIVGKPFADAQAILEKAGFKVEKQDGPPPTDDQPPGTVTKQNPNAGSRAEEGALIYLAVAMTEPADVPKGLVAFFNGEGCPNGWRVAEYAQGRLIVAVDEGGVVGKQVGAEPLEDQEDPRHRHTYTGRVNLGNKTIAAASGGGNRSATSRGGHSFSGTTKEAPTGLPFIQHVICEKQ